MKKMRQILMLLSLLALISTTGYAQETISMGEGYADDVYYSMSEGVTGITDRTDWDLGFYTLPWSAGIITNGGSGIELYAYPHGDTSAWMAIDTNGLSTWPILYNGEDSWENGAFNRNAKNHPDYGWGVYSSITHDVVGDSLFIIKLMDGSYKKIWIVKKISVANQYIIRYGDLDNGNDRTKTLNNNDYSDMNFSYFDFQSGSFFDREPASDTWDILFTKYQAMQPQGVPYPVVGVLNNVDVNANRFHPVTLDFNNWFEQPMDTSKAVIGFNWKYFDMGSFTWTLEDSLLFFVNSLEGDIYKLYFTYFEGTTSGDIQFELELVSMLDIDQAQAQEEKIFLTPNPANNYVNVSWNANPGKNATLHIYSMSGKEVLHQALFTDGNTNQENKIDISRLQKGMYVLSIFSEGKAINEKLIVE